MQAQQVEAKLRDYRIVVEEQLEASWGEWLGVVYTEGEQRSRGVQGTEGEQRTRGVQGTEGEQRTTLILPQADQTALRTLLSRLWDLNITVISVNPVIGAVS